MKGVLNVTDHEFDKILQLTHDAIEWTNTDVHVLEGVANLLGNDVASKLKTFDDIRMEKHDSISDLPRVQLLRERKPNMNKPNTNRKEKDERAADVPAKYPPATKPAADDPYPKGSTVEETNSDRDIEEKQTVSGD